MAKPRLIILVRHGESQGNKDKSVNRYIPNHKVPLTEKGHLQAHKAGEQLRELLDPDNDEIMFYTSPYMRTRQTLQGLIDGMGKDFTEKIKYQIHEEPRMREQDFGNFQSDSEKMEEIWMERADYGHFFYRIPYGESAADVYDRVSGFNETLFRQFSADKFPSVLVLVTHGIWARVFLMKWYRWSVEQFEELTNVPHCKFIVMERECVSKPEDECEKFKYKLLTHLTTWSDLEAIEAQNSTNGKENTKNKENEAKGTSDTSLETKLCDDDLCANGDLDDASAKLEKDLALRKNFLKRDRKDHTVATEKQ